MPENTKISDKQIKDQPASIEKLPYVKPELHLLDLDGTEGKTFAKTFESTFGTSLASNTKVAPS